MSAEHSAMKFALFSDKAEQSRHRSAEAPSLNFLQVIIVIKAGTEIRFSPATNSGSLGPVVNIGFCFVN